jgi:hypothetical protein
VTALHDSPRQQLERMRVVADLNTAYLELLSAQAATDRLCVNNSLQSIIHHCEKEKVLRVIATACSIYEYYAKLGACLHQQ